ncbi:MAG: DNA-binding response regulator [Flammeovirgaceae bacterium]|nr:DNA-binding response regulator [Flammeovirgaceae bacterium]MBR07990.1 DNA-binding response regulator [Rickettsiales bacterium]|tara:strand:- start:73 stop:807 length:735 start_codon:yes stop_codon:yes gene_type:complete
MTLRCLAVDDEPLALGLISSFIDQTPFLELVAKYDNAIEALRHLHGEDPIDLLFLDIQMSDLTGIELARILDGIPAENKPLIVFTTAFDQFAIEGYKVNAIDYLLKPFNYEEFLRAASKARTLRSSKTETVQKPTGETADYIFLKVEYQLVKVMLADIRYIEGLKDYVKVHLESKEHPILSLSSLKSMEEKLPEKQFMRIHRSYIVNLQKIDSITKTYLQIGKEQLTISENYRDVFHARIKSGL